MKWQSRVIIIICLWLAFLLRVWGLDFGLPYELHPDEHQYVDLALNWLITGQLEARFVNPPLFTYILVVAFWFWLALTPYSPTAEWVTTAFVFARLWSVFFGMLTVALVYPLGQRLSERKAGLLGMILMTGLFLPARESHFAVNDAIVTFFGLLAIYFSLLVFWRRQWQSYVAAGLAIGLATGAKFTAGLVVLPLLVAHSLSWKSNPRLFIKGLLTDKRHRYLWLSLFVAFVTFLTISAPTLYQFYRFVNRVNELIQFGAEGFGGIRMGPATGWQFYITALGWGIGWLMFWAITVALGIVLLRRQPQGLILSVFPIALFIYMGAQKAFSARYILPAVPPLVILVAVGMARLENQWPVLRQYQLWGRPLLLGVLLAQPLANLIWFNYLLTLPDTREIATEWFTQEFPEETVVVKEHYSILPKTAFLNEHWPYKIISLDNRGATRNQIDYYVSHKTEVIALGSFNFERIRQNRLEEAARLKQLAFVEEKAELIKTFSPYHSSYQADWFYLDQLYGPAAETLQRVRPGPLIKLYRLPYESQPHSLEAPPISAPVRANFGGKLMLLGYDLPVRRAESGGAFPLTLYWQALSRMHETYVVFNHLLDNQQRNWGGYDRWPQETAKTTLWTPGEIVVDTFNLPIATDATDGIYTIDIGLYDEADPKATPLSIIHDDGLVEQNSVRIGPVKVGGPPPDIVLSPSAVTPQELMSVQLGDPPVILLRGYDLTQLEHELSVTLYWESLAQSPIDWTTFVHVRNKTGQILAQKDGPTGAGHYPTSLWDTGEIIADEITIPLEKVAEDSYDIFVGLYEWSSGARLTVPGNPASEIRLDQKIALGHK